MSSRWESEDLEGGGWPSGALASFKLGTRAEGSWQRSHYGPEVPWTLLIGKGGREVTWAISRKCLC